MLPFLAFRFLLGRFFFQGDGSLGSALCCFFFQGVGSPGDALGREGSLGSAVKFTSYS